MSKQWFVPFKDMKTGETFGELALEARNNSEKPPPRAATIKVSGEGTTIFGTVFKEDYE